MSAARWRPVRFLLRLFFHHLYHRFAWAYDFVAAVVSLGQWNEWATNALQFVEGKHILEIGCGPGHLQRALAERRVFTVGLDESREMLKLARQRLGRAGILTRGRAQSLPFATEAFDAVLCTFPSEYILDANSLSSIWRVMNKRGKLIVLAGAWPHHPLLTWLYRVTGETPTRAVELFAAWYVEPLQRAGFTPRASIVRTASASLLYILATR